MPTSQSSAACLALSPTLFQRIAVSIVVTKVATDLNSYTARYTIELLEDLDSPHDGMDDVDVEDVPDRIREALIDWALGDPICEECAAEHEALSELETQFDK